MSSALCKPVTVRYAEPDYWEARYQREPTLFEWFFGHTALRRILRTYISKKKPILHVGCGTSNLQEGMARSGYSIINTDISEVVIKQMKQRHAQYSNMTYRVSDCRNMPEFTDCSFGHVLDKGTMDALLCCKQGTENVMQMLLEIYRVLQPGGSFLLVTLGDPTRRLPLLCDARLPWKVSLLLLPKISAANQAYVDGKPINDSTEPVEAQGPFEVIDADTILDLPSGLQYTNFFFAYVCKKQPLQLPQHQGQKAALPNGWVAGSKELFQKLQKELGLPEDLLAKGRRKRVMHVPAGQASMHGLPCPAGHASSAASAASGTSSPISLAALQSGHSNNSLPAPPLQELQSALTALQLEEQQQTAAASSEASGARDLPARPASAPNLVGILEGQAAAAVEATLVEQAVLPAMVDGQTYAVSIPGGASVAPAAGVAPSFHSPCLSAVGGAGAHAPAAGLQVQQLLPPAALLVPQLNTSSNAAGPAAANSDTQLLVHFVSSPGNLQPTASAADSISEQDAGAPEPQTPAVMQVLNFAAPAARYIEPAGCSGAAATAAEAAASGGALLEPSPLPPSGKSLVSSTPNSPAAGLPSHVASIGGSSGCQPPPLWPGSRLQAGQVLPQLAGHQQQALAAAAAAGMFPLHSVAPHSLRAPRLRRFSTEYGATSGCALQMQLEQLRLIQAQHSESAADGLVLHDVAAADSCGSGAAAAAAVAVAAWDGCVRPPRDRRLSNISVLSGLSVVSSVSIDESGEEVADGQFSAVNTVACSSEPSCHLLSPQADGSAHGGAAAGSDAMPLPRKGSHLLSPDGQHAQS